MKKARIILDTNLWISFLISINYSFIDQLIIQNKVILLFSEESILEFIEVVKRPKFKKYFSNQDVEKILELFESYGELVDVKSDVDLCRDSKDNFLLNLSIDGEADYLVTGDKDLLILQKISNTEMITMSGFLELMS